MGVRPHKRLLAWQESMNLYVFVFKLTGSFPKSEIYGLTSQMRRAALSVACNIAEGAAKESSKDFSRFLNHSEGSLSELETQIEAAQRVDYINEQSCSEALQLTGKCSALISGLKRKLKSTQ